MAKVRETIPGDNITSMAGCSSQSSSPYQPDSKFINLPLDIILGIFDYLKANHAIALSLTCKGLHTHLFADARTLFDNANNKGRLKVQRMLEMNLPPNHVYCPFCKTFHSLDERYREAHCLESQSPHISSIHAPIVNAHIWGRLSSAREQLQTLRKKHCRPPPTVGNGWRKWWWPEVTSRGDLEVCITSQHVQSDARDKDEVFEYSVCEYASIRAQFPYMWTNLTMMDFLGYRSGKFARGKCKRCNADCAVMVKWTFDNEAATACDNTPPAGWEIEFKSRHRLGRLRSPNDQAWALCAGEYSAPKVRRNEGSSLLEDGGHAACLRVNYLWTDLKGMAPSQRAWNQD
ncbi:hypothetical protein DHEL01_v203270 [Diaporthe helianthi]|uniref:F-box domain-containing protein n=1 Tax=Diaporthe helianthi TaxID=158607 RepID=A0A2P5I764_DIAHE|nr:hypothetical protein DHEL01_v203270 [Diaporthe helianthi]